ncbi:MAG TPA: tetratricopeptide repeat protein [candidate division Zixibacteria bacterium]
MEKVKKDAYEKAIQGANSSVSWAGRVIAAISLFAIALGVFGYLQGRALIKQMEGELERAKEIKDEVQKKKEEVEGLCEEIKQMRSKAAEIVRDAEKITEEAKKTKTPLDFSEEAKAIISEKDAEKTIQRYEKLTDKIFGEDAKLVYNQLAFSYYRLQRYEEEISILRKTIQINPKDAIAYYNWGVALGELGKHEEVIEKCKKAIELKPDLTEAYYNWGVALIKLGKYEEAIEKCKKAIEIKPDYAEAHYNLAYAFAELKDKNQMLKYLKDAINLDNKYREKSKTDTDFKTVWNDPDFKKLVE